ncbi:type 1 periplasmic binding fold superfamily protein [Antarcticibacterium flavum]|uniref:Type 1 periplasmic binding fold superfamily protein n=1 Tax=Antarcticibacterium flavum TaxID=2058175 RepID=A0A5B7X494_9FLAO|nr:MULTISPECIES: type 1 periplasmic binding fold superfamily protein [Antarcticibacterium]MCM4158508.1 type 1 periplasmic binding fold superfamily protein [Antarcticibacterium sp. W02-3]QCY70256.1 type 1 periplasmic binding fold superfamily protein [Antarcticibacterium flavum]
MKTIKFLSMFAIAGALLTSCSSDDDNTPEPVNEEEVITTLRVTLVPEEGGETIIMEYRDLDGDGPTAPVITVSGNLAANTIYFGSTEVWNELEEPADNITLEVAEEADEHQFFYNPGSGLDVRIIYTDEDDNGNPVGINFTMTTMEASEGTLTVTLIHLPNKDAEGVAEGDVTNAGGETDAEVTFNVTVE